MKVFVGRCNNERVAIPLENISAVVIVPDDATVTVKRPAGDTYTFDRVEGERLISMLQDML
jgi:hypothetical protein